jgi:hypothetical protein
MNIMRLIDAPKFLLVFTVSFAIDFALARMPFLAERGGSLLAWVELGFPVFGYYLAMLSVPAVKEFGRPKRHIVSVIVAFILTVPTLIALLFYGITLRGGQLTD